MMMRVLHINSGRLFTVIESCQADGHGPLSLETHAGDLHYTLGSHICI